MLTFELYAKEKSNIYILYININKKIPISMIFNIFFRVVKILLGNRYLLKNY